jgi:signal transduction histidine kinase
VSAVRRNGSLVVRVRDDGIGGAQPTAGSGLMGMTDRVAALGGTVSVDSPHGRGTIVTAELPCES